MGFYPSCNQPLLRQAVKRKAASSAFGEQPRHEGEHPEQKPQHPEVFLITSWSLSCFSISLNLINLLILHFKPNTFTEFHNRPLERLKGSFYQQRKEIQISRRPLMKTIPLWGAPTLRQLVLNKQKPFSLLQPSAFWFWLLHFTLPCLRHLPVLSAWLHPTVPHCYTQRTTLYCSTELPLLGRGEPHAAGCTSHRLLAGTPRSLTSQNDVSFPVPHFLMDCFHRARTQLCRTSARGGDEGGSTAP